MELELYRYQQLKEVDLTSGQTSNKRIHQTRENYEKDEKTSSVKYRAIQKHCNPKGQKLLIWRYSKDVKLTVTLGRVNVKSTLEISFGLILLKSIWYHFHIAQVAIAMWNRNFIK